jgi:hypothetical protein
MRAKTSKKPENPSSLLSRMIAGGKRKGESYREALSLQDVFSDSGNDSGSSQKTYLPSDTERGKRAQLEGKSKLKPARGRRRLEQKQKRAIKLQMHVTVKEYEKLNDQFRASGIRYLSDFLRILILDKRKSANITNKHN